MGAAKWYQNHLKQELKKLGINFYSDSDIEYLENMLKQAKHRMKTGILFKFKWSIDFCTISLRRII